VFAAVAWDITHARRQIDLYSPFLNAPATRRWLPPLRDAALSGVKVVVTTRPHAPEEPQGALCAELRAAGIDVQDREAMHEKVLIIDDVLWHGSLNLLAHTRSTDLMMRMVSAVSAEQVRRIVHRAHPTRPAPTYQRGNTENHGAPGKTRPPDTTDRIYLEVPYEEKDQAKGLGGTLGSGVQALVHRSGPHTAGPGGPLAPHLTRPSQPAPPAQATRTHAWHTGAERPNWHT
jgi:hypothetical protein